MAAPAAAAAVGYVNAPTGKLPEQQGGSADGRGHEAGTDQTRSKTEPRNPDSAPATGLPADLTRPGPDFTPPPEARTTVRTGDSGGEAKSGFDENNSRELTGQRTEDTQVFLNPDGTQTRRMHQSRTFYQRADGTWDRIDTSLVRDGASLRSKADSIDKVFGATANAGTVASLELEGDLAVGYGLKDSRPAQGKVEGDTVTYPDARPNADLELESNTAGIKETIILKSADAPTEWEFPLKLKGLTASLDAGSVVLKDSSGQVKAVVPPGFMEDSAVDPQSGQGAISRGVTYRLDGDTLKVSLDRTWLRDPARVFPVKADPSVVTQTGDGTTYVQSPYNADNSGDPNISVGTYNGGANKANAFIKFDSVSSALAGHYILGVNLHLYNTHSYSCSPRTIWINSVTQPWNLTGNKTWPGPAYGNELGSATFATGYNSCSPNGAWHRIDLGDRGRDLVHGWTHGQANNGVTIRTADNDSSSWKKFAGRNSANAPFLEITSSPYWATYQVGAMDPMVTSSQDGTVQVTVTNHGRDTWSPSNNYKMSYRIWDSAGNELSGEQPKTDMPRDVRPGETVTVATRIGKLQPGDYKLNFDVDHYGYAKFSWWGVPMSPGLDFTILNQVPVVESMSPPNGANLTGLTPTLALTGRDRDTYPGLGLAYLFKICDAEGDGQQNCTDSGWSSSSTWTVPAGKLTWGKDYVWYGAIGDWNGNSPWTGGSQMTTYVTQPAVTGRLASGSETQGLGFDALAGNYTTSTTDLVLPVVGPALSVARAYNSLDPRRDLAFGAGWSTRWDARLVRDNDGTGNVVITLPDGQQSRFGRNPDGSYASPPGWFATLVTAQPGWTLTTKDHTTYAFDDGGRLTRITDDRGRVQTLTHVDGKLATATDQASGRALKFTWGGGHVTRVEAAADSTVAWTYTYSGDKLTKVCDPTGACATHDYTTSLHYKTATLNSNPLGYWRLHEDSGTVSHNYAPLTGHAANATMVDIALRAPGAMPGSHITSGSFNGTSSHLRLPDNTLTGKNRMSVEMWFKTNTPGGVLYSTSADRPGAANPQGGATPVLYIGTDGKLRGHFANGSLDGITTAGAVTDNTWHHVVLSADYNTQSLYLDGVLVGTQSGLVGNPDPYHHVGAGRVSGAAWPSRPANDWGYFTGQLTEIAVYGTPLGSTTVADHWAARTTSDALIKTTLPGGRVADQITYDVADDRLRLRIDGNGGHWILGSPAIYTDKRTVISTTDPKGRVTNYDHDPSRGGRLTSFTSVANGERLTYYEYDTGGFVNKVIDQNGVHTLLSNDARGNVLSRTVCASACTTGPTSYTSYYLNTNDKLDPRNDKPTEQRDARTTTGPGTGTTYAYNASGDLTGSTFPGATAEQRRSTSITYTTGGEPAPGGGTMPAGLVLSTTDARGGITTNAYTRAGDLQKVTDPAGLATTYTYDALGRRTSEFTSSTAIPGPTGSTTTYSYDKLSRLVGQLSPRTVNAVSGVPHQQRLTNTYNPDGTLASVKLDDAELGDNGRQTSYTYDGNGRLATTTDPTGAVTRTEYDVMGALSKKVDAAGTEFTYTYTTARHQAATTTVKGFTGEGGAPRDVVLESLAYDPGGRLASRTDAMGRTTAYTYLADGNTETETLLDYRDPDTGQTANLLLTRYTYDPAGLITQVSVRNDAKVTKTTRDPAGRPTSVLEIDNQCAAACGHNGPARTTTYTYDAGDNTTSVVLTNPDGSRAAQTGHTHDALGRELTTTVHTGTGTLVTTTTRDQRGLVLSTIDPRGSTTTYSYDSAGRPTIVTGTQVDAERDGGAPVAVVPVTRTGYNTYGEPVEVVDPLGNTTRAAYDDAGRPTSTTLPVYTSPHTGTQITSTSMSTYDGLGRTTSTTDGAGNTTDYGYDQLGNQIRRTAPPAQTGGQRATWSAAFTPTGEQLSATDPLGARIHATYDMLGQAITSTVVERVPAPIRNLTTQLRYDSLGTLKSTTDPGGHTSTYANNDLGKPVVIKNPLGHTTTARYDAAGRALWTVDPNGTKTASTYDLAGRQTSASALDGGGTVLRTGTFGYDSGGAPVSETDSLGVTTTRGYDAAGRLTSVTRPTSANTSITTGYGYDAAGNLTRVTDANGNTTVHTTNSWGLAESIIEPATAQHPSPASRTFTNSYDAAGRAVHTRKPGGVTGANTYDGTGNLTRQNAVNGASALSRSFEHDLTGRITTAVAGTNTNTYAYDDRGNLVGATGSSGNSTFAYDNDNQLALVTTAAGTTAYGYDAASRMSSAQDPLTGTTSLYTYDNAGQVKAIGHGLGASTRNYAYDALGRITGDTVKAPNGNTTVSTSYTYDTEDRLTGKTTTGVAGAAANTYAYDQADRLTRWSSGSATTEYAYDAVGNLLRDGATTSTYNERNQLLTRGETTYTYTPRGTQSSRTTAGTTTTVAFDAFDQLASDGATGNTYDALGRLTTTGGKTLAYLGAGLTVVNDGANLYTHTATGTPLGIKQGTVSSLAVADRHTDLVATTDPATGAVTTSRSYTPFGAVQASAGTQPGLGYQSQYTDPATGNVNMGARWYQPGSGTFTSRDTATLDPTDLANANRHSYTSGNPLNMTDPSGHAAGVLIGPLIGIGRGLAPYVGRAIPAISNGARFLGQKIQAGFNIVVGGAVSAFHWASTTTIPGRAVAAPSPTVNYPLTGTPVRVALGRGGPQKTNGGRGTPPKFTDPYPPGGRTDKPGGGGGGWRPPFYDDEAANEAVSDDSALINALTFVARLVLTPAIAPGVQSQLDSANSAPRIEIGATTVDPSQERGFDPGAQEEPGGADASRRPPPVGDDPDRKCTENWDTYGDWGGEGKNRATGASACIVTTNKSARPKLEFYLEGRGAGMARCHLLGHKLNGSSTNMKNFVPCYQNPTNNSWMYHAVEKHISNRVGDPVRFPLTADPVRVDIRAIYANETTFIPMGIEINAVSNSGWTCRAVIPNVSKGDAEKYGIIPKITNSANPKATTC